MKKSSEELKIVRQNQRRQLAEKRIEDACIREEKANERKAEARKVQIQDAKDKEAALRLYNKYYKEEFKKRKNTGRSGKRQSLLK